MALEVRPIPDMQYLEYINALPSVSFLQLPSWGRVKALAGWDSINLGWFNGDDLVGVGLVLLRKVPRMKRYLAYLPEGPNLDWDGARLGLTLEAWLDPMLRCLKAKGAFAVKMGPQVEVARWHPATIKAAISDEAQSQLSTLTPDSTNPVGVKLIQELRANGWTQPAATGAGFGDYQPRFVYQIPLNGKTEDELFSSFNQLWRRNIRKAEKAGVEVSRGSREELTLFHPVYVETAERDGFVPRNIAYFERMWDSMNAEEDGRFRLYLARHEGAVVAATTAVVVGDHTWYSYGASSSAGRDVRPSNAIQWAMMRDALHEGRATYDMRGISETLDESNPLFGLLRFKVGTGGDAVEYVGEWDYALRPTLAKAFDIYMKRGELKSRVIKVKSS